MFQVICIWYNMLWRNEGEDISLFLQGIQHFNVVISNLFKSRWKVLFFHPLLRTCSHSHAVGSKFTGVNRKICSDNSFFEQAICYWPHQWWDQAFPCCPVFLPHSTIKKTTPKSLSCSLCQNETERNHCYCLHYFTNTQNNKRIILTSEKKKLIHLHISRI